LKKLLLFLLIAAPAAFAQEATLTAPETITKAVVTEFVIERASASARIRVEFQTAAGVGRRAITYQTANLTELNSLLTAVGTAKNTPQAETGSAQRRFNYRVLGWLVDNGKLVDEAGATISVTLVP
jgi:hypothetical protein